VTSDASGGGRTATVAARPPQDTDSTYERTPPQDLNAEQSVLGGMLLSKDAISDVVEILRTSDFYRPHHAIVFDAIVALYGKGEPADPVTVAAALTDAGALVKVGGAPYLHTLIASVPTAANAGYYARIVADRAGLRRVIEAGTQVVQIGYGAAGDAGSAADVIDRAQQIVYDIADRDERADVSPLGTEFQGLVDSIEAAAAGGGGIGIPTGFADLDRLLNGLHPGQLVIVAGRPGLGKALALDTPLPTPDGWTAMGDVRIGDRLLDAQGRPTTVTALSDVMLNRACYEVEFSDRSVIVADGSHRWLTSTMATRRHRRPPQVSTTAQIQATLRTETPDRRINHAVAVASPLVLPERSLLVAPYTLGVWLGHGHSAAARFTTADPEVVTYVEADGYVAPWNGRMSYAIKLPRRGEGHACATCATPISANGRKTTRRCRDCHSRGSVTGLLREIGVLGNKHIPGDYLRASETQRRALLAGLLDTAGTVAPTGSVQLCVTSRLLAENARELVVSLGYRCAVTTKPVRGRTEASSTAYTLDVSTSDEVFRLERKRLAHKDRCRTRNPARNGLRYIVDVRPIPSVPVRCVTVDNADHLYLAGRSMIPTHNSTAAMDFARAATIKHNLPSAIFSLEMSKLEIVTRVLSAEARVPLNVLRSGMLSDDDWTKMARRMGEISEAPMFVDDTPSMNLMEIRAKARRLKQRNDLKLVVVDYLQLMTSPKRTESRQQEVAEISRGLKLLAKEIECPVIAVSQLNREAENRKDHRPQLSDLRESGSIEQDADVVILLHRDDYYDKESPRAGEADFIVAKHRNGPTDTVTVAAQLHLSRFVDMALTP
jgi:replicative DNA helicase